MDSNSLLTTLEYCDRVFCKCILNKYNLNKFLTVRLTLLKYYDKYDGTLIYECIKNEYTSGFYYLYNEGYKLESTMYKTAIDYGNYECIKFLVDHKIEMTGYECCMLLYHDKYASKNAHCDHREISSKTRFNILKLFVENKFPMMGIECLLASCFGYYDCLKYLLINNSKLTGIECQCAAFFGHLKCLKLLMQYDNNIESDKLRTDEISYERLFDYYGINVWNYAMEYRDARDTLFRCVYDTAKLIGRMYEFDIFGSLIEIAAFQNHLKCVKYLHKCGYKITHNMSRIASCNGNYELFVYCCEHIQKKVNCEMCKDIDMKYTRGGEVFWNILNNAHGDCIKLLKYALNTGYEIAITQFNSERVCDQLLIYMVFGGEDEYNGAYDNIKCLRYAMQNNFVANVDILFEYWKSRCIRCFVYSLDNLLEKRIIDREICMNIYHKCVDFLHGEFTGKQGDILNNFVKRNRLIE